MTDQVTSGSRGRSERLRLWRPGSTVGALQLALAVAVAVLLAIDAYVHFHDAHFYHAVRTSTLSEATLFRIQASVAVAVAVALLAYPGSRVVWAIAVLVAASAFGAVLLYTYVHVGKLGPLPDLYEGTWKVPGKVASAVAEGIATVLAVAGFATAVMTRPRARHGQG